MGYSQGYDDITKPANRQTRVEITPCTGSTSPPISTTLPSPAAAWSGSRCRLVMRSASGRSAPARPIRPNRSHPLPSPCTSAGAPARPPWLPAGRKTLPPARCWEQLTATCRFTTASTAGMAQGTTTTPAKRRSMARCTRMRLPGRRRSPSSIWMHLPAGVSLVCPLSLGNHVDHQLTRLAAEQTRAPLVLLRRLPLCAQAARIICRRWRRPAGSRQCTPLSPGGLKAWQDCVAAHASQISTFWADEAAMRAAIAALRRPGVGSLPVAARVRQKFAQTNSL